MYTIEPQKFLDFFSRVGGCQEFLAGGKINTIIAGITVRRATHNHVHFLGSCLPECLDTISGSSSSNDGVLNDDESLVAQQRAYGIELYSYMEVSHGLGGLDKSTAYVVVTDYAHFQWNAGGLGESKGCIVARVGKRHNYVGVHLIFPGHLVPLAFAGQVNILAKNAAVRSGKVDKLKNAEGGAVGKRELSRPDPIVVDEYDLSRLNVPHVSGPDEIQGTGLRGDDIGVVV
jgi:hypothetical protein